VEPVAVGLEPDGRARVLPVTRPLGRTVPYYKVPVAWSVWAATGFGSLQSDLVERILRGERRG
jgi:hypothetical protein